MLTTVAVYVLVFLLNILTCENWRSTYRMGLMALTVILRPVWHSVLITIKMISLNTCNPILTLV